MFRINSAVLAAALSCGLAHSSASGQPTRIPRPPRSPLINEGNVVPSYVADEPQERTGSWLGVQLAPVPAALASHLGLGEEGLIVRNVYKDSPADRAGLERYDVIVEADGKKVAGEVKDFSQNIRHKKPGEPLALKIFRKGKETTLTLKLEEVPAAAERMELKYPEDPDVLYRRNFGLRGKILRPGPEGWALEDLGELPDFDQLIQRFGPKWVEKRFPPESEVNEARRVDKKGEVLHVRQLKDGRIEVRRYKATEDKEKAEPKTYANMEELRKADAEAADLLQSRGNRRWEQKLTRPGGPDVERLEPRWREWAEGFLGGPMRERGGDEAPDVRFDVQPDGQVTVHKRQADAELNMTFKSKDEFKQRAPELFKRFEEMDKSVR